MNNDKSGRNKKSSLKSDYRAKDRGCVEEINHNCREHLKGQELFKTHHVRLLPVDVGGGFLYEYPNTTL